MKLSITPTPLQKAIKWFKFTTSAIFFIIGILAACGVVTGTATVVIPLGSVVISVLSLIVKFYADSRARHVI